MCVACTCCWTSFRLDTAQRPAKAGRGCVLGAQRSAAAGMHARAHGTRAQRRRQHNGLKPLPASGPYAPCCARPRDPACPAAPRHRCRRPLPFARCRSHRPPRHCRCPPRWTHCCCRCRRCRHARGGRASSRAFCLHGGRRRPAAVGWRRRPAGCARRASGVGAVASAISAKQAPWACGSPKRNSAQRQCTRRLAAPAAAVVAAPPRPARIGAGGAGAPASAAAN